MKIDETKDPKISYKVKEYIDALDGKLSNPKQISIESEFEGLIIDDYPPHQKDKLPTNKWEEE